MRRVIVEIDRLVLTGIPREEARSIAEGLRQELAQVFADREVVSQLRSSGDLPRLQVRGPQIERSSAPRRLAASVAQGIRREMAK